MFKYDDTKNDQKPITMRVMRSDHEQMKGDIAQLRQENLQLLKENAEAMKKIAGLEKMLAAYVDRSQRQEKEIERLYSQVYPINLPDGVLKTTSTEGLPLSPSQIIRPNN